MDEMNECIVLGETRKKDKIKFDDHKVEKISEYRYKDIKECIEQFHSSIAVGPLYVCTCCHQTWFRKGVCMLKNINLPTSSRYTVQNLYQSMMKSGFVTLVLEQ